MTAPSTLLKLSGADLTPARVSESALIFIDFQNEYRAGPLELTGCDAAIAAAERLLSLARRQGSPVIHVVHKGRPGGLFDREGERGQIVAPLTPQAGEELVEKTFPNAFAGTDLHAILQQLGRNTLIITGFMTHMCVSATTRAALDLGYRTTIDANCCATRDLPDGDGVAIRAATVHKVALAELADRFAIVVWGRDQIQ